MTKARRGKVIRKEKSQKTSRAWRGLTTRESGAGPERTESLDGKSEWTQDQHFTALLKMTRTSRCLEDWIIWSHDTLESTWQVAEVRKPLVSASHIIQAGSDLVIGKNEAYIMNRKKSAQKGRQRVRAWFVREGAIRCSRANQVQSHGSWRNQSSCRAKGAKEASYIRLQQTNFLTAGWVSVEDRSKRTETVRPQVVSSAKANQSVTVRWVWKAMGMTLSYTARRTMRTGLSDGGEEHSWPRPTDCQRTPRAHYTSTVQIMVQVLWDRT